MLINKKLLIVSSLILSTALSGCSFNNIRTAEKNITSDKSEVNRLREISKQPMPAANVAPISFNDGYWITDKGVKNENGEPLPEMSNILIKTAGPVPIWDITKDITSQTNIPIKIAPELLRSIEELETNLNEAEEQNNNENGPNTVGPFENSLQSLLPSNFGSPASGGQNVSQPPVNKMSLDYEGTLKNALNTITTYFNAAWEYKNSTIYIYKNITREFTLDVTKPMVINSQFQSFEDTVFEEMEGYLNKLLKSEEGERYSISQTSGKIVVTASRSNIENVESFINNQNKVFSKQVAVSFKVYSLRLSDTDDYDMDLNAIFSGSSRFGFELGSAVGAISQNGFGWSIIDPNSKWTGSESVVKLLSEKGDLSVMTGTTLSTINGNPVPFKSLKRNGYLYKTSVSTTDATSEIEYEPKTLETGFDITLTPKIMSNGNLKIKYFMDITENDGFDEIGDVSTGRGIQLENVSQNTFYQELIVPNNATLVMAGYEKNRSEVNKSGTGAADFWALGGSQKGGITKEILVVVMTPSILDTNHTNK